MKQKRLGIMLQIIAGVVFVTSPMLFKNDFNRIAPGLVERTIQSLNLVGVEENSSDDIISSRVLKIDFNKIQDPAFKELKTDTKQMRLEFDPAHSKASWSLWLKLEQSLTEIARSPTEELSQWEKISFKKINKRWTTEFIEIPLSGANFKIVSGDKRPVLKEFIVRMNDSTKEY